MYSIFCLGNPGLNYSFTRHNVGFIFADLISKFFCENFSIYSKFDSEVCKCLYKDQRIYLIKPHTYMNNSGFAAIKFNRYYNIVEENTFVIYDDIDLPLGKVKIKKGGGNGGHNGIRSLDKHLSNKQYIKIRVGVNRPPNNISTANYVLSNFTEEEILVLRLVAERFLNNLFLLFDYKFDFLMSRINL